MKVIDDKSKKVTWYNRNYFYLGTIIVIVINILIFYFLGNDWESSFKVSSGGDAAFDYDNLVRLFMNAFSHADWEHVLLNMLCFLICGIYIERKIGSINMLLLVLVLTPMANWTAGANRLSVNSHGFSCVLYALYAYLIIDFIFSFQKHRRNLTNTIIGIVALIYIYVSMSWDSSKSFPFVWYPIDFIFHKGHYSGFLIGAIFSLTLQLVSLYVRKRTIAEFKVVENTSQNNNKINTVNTINNVKPGSTVQNTNYNPVRPSNLPTNTTSVNYNNSQNINSNNSNTNSDK